MSKTKECSPRNGHLWLCQAVPLEPVLLPKETVGILIQKVDQNGDASGVVSTERRTGRCLPNQSVSHQSRTHRIWISYQCSPGLISWAHCRCRNLDQKLWRLRWEQSRKSARCSSLSFYSELIRTLGGSRKSCLSGGGVSARDRPALAIGTKHLWAALAILLPFQWFPFFFWNTAYAFFFLSYVCERKSISLVTTLEFRNFGDKPWWTQVYYIYPTVLVQWLNGKSSHIKYKAKKIRLSEAVLMM